MFKSPTSFLYLGLVSMMVGRYTLKCCLTFWFIYCCLTGTVFFTFSLNVYSALSSSYDSSFLGVCVWTDRCPFPLCTDLHGDITSYSECIEYCFETIRPHLCYDIILQLHSFIRHINPLMFDVIDDKPEGVAQGVCHV